MYAESCIITFDFSNRVFFVTEHQILEAMIKDSSIELLDELFVEAHYEHFFRGGIMTFHRYWSDIRDTLLRLRARGVCAHEWF